MKHLLIIAFLLTIFSCKNEVLEQQKTVVRKDSVAVRNYNNAQPKIDSAKHLEETVLQIVKAFKSKDARILNTFIDPAVGFYFIQGPGTISDFTKMDALDFSDPQFEYHRFGSPKKVNFRLMATDEKPQFDCETRKWDKYGLFIVSNKHVLGDILRQQQLNEIETTAEKRKIADNIDAMSKIVVLAEKDGDIVFGIAEHNGKFILTFLDFRDSYCDV